MLECSFYMWGFQTCAIHVRETPENLGTPLLDLQNEYVRQSRGWSLLSGVRDHVYNEHVIRIERLNV